MIAASPPSPDARAKRMAAALIEGANLEELAARECVAPKEAEIILREELGRRWVAPPAEFAKIQIARLEGLCLHAMDRVDGGELAAIDRALRIIDRLDRYHGFSRATPAIEHYTDEDRQRLKDKLSAVAARLYGEQPESRSEP